MSIDADTVSALRAENEALRQENEQLRQRIVELEQSEAAHRANSEYLHLVLRSMPVMIDAVEPQGSVAFWNNECERITGYSSDEIVGNPAAIELLYPDAEYRAWVLAGWASHVEAGLDWELQLATRDGSTRTVIWKNVMVPPQPVAGSPSWYVAIDVTEHKQYEQELRQSQVLLQGILDNSPMAVLLKDTTGHYILCNDYAASLLRCTPQEVLGKTDYDFYLADIAQEMREHDQQIIATGTPLENEQTILRDDELCTFLKVNFPLYDDEGNAYAIGGFMTDITERKQVEDRLYEVQQMLRMVMDNLPQAIFWKDRNLNYLGCNRRFAEIAGLASPDEIVGKSDYDMPWVDQVEFYRGDDYRVMSTDTPTYNSEEPIEKADGSSGWLLTSKIPLHDNSGNVFAMLGMFEDITEWKQAEADLLTFKAVAENTFDGLAFVSVEGIITYANRAMKAMMGYGDALVGNPADVVFGGDTEKPREIINQVIEHGTWQGVLDYYRKDGSTIPVHISVFSICDANGQPVLFPGFIRDLTELNAAEAERHALQQQLIDAQRATISELSAPLLPLSSHVIALPLVGAVDSNRAQQIMETLLEGIATYQSDIAIVDITGVSVMDTQVAQALIRTAQAVKLLGAQVVLTGIQPQMAQTLIHLGADLGGIVTQGTFQAGIAYALGHLANSEPDASAAD